MTDNANPNQVVFTNLARCRDCYRCIRSCPVDAIGIKDGQAFVDEHRCVSCGTCIRECPQKAKTYRQDLAEVQEMVQNGKVAVSIAPAFACMYEAWEIKRIPSMLRGLGFSYVAETAVGASIVSDKIRELDWCVESGSVLSTACPAFVEYIVRYRPEFKSLLMELVSPMLAHGRHLKAKMGLETKVVFIGPCSAKKMEAGQDETNSIDAVLTFAELNRWVEQEEISPGDFEESMFDEQPDRTARLYPLEGGGLKTASIEVDFLKRQSVTISGISEIEDMLDSLAGMPNGCMVEPLFCSQGCINGPLMQTQKPVFERQKSILDYYADCTGADEPGIDTSICLRKEFKDRVQVVRQFTEEQIRQVLEMTGKLNPEDQLDCGTCGYSTCREQAEAVLRDMAEADMCVSYMRKLAEQRTDKIIETSPNGIVMLDISLSILHMNSSFKKMFMCTDSVVGKPISYLIDSGPFEKVAMGMQDIYQETVQHEKYSLVCHEIIYALPQEEQIAGVFVDLTSTVKDKQKYTELQTQTVEQARFLLEQLTDMAGKMAEYLGNSTAHSEQLLANLIKIAQEKSLQEEIGANSWLKDIYTVK